MIYLLSDFHGGESVRGLREYLETAQDDDLLIVLGDVGLKFDSTEENIAFDRLLLSARKNIAFLDGNHENFPYLNSFPVETWHGGSVHRLTDKVVHLMRGNIYTIDGKTFFTFGGCKSSAKWKAMGLWYPGEEPTEEEIALARENLARHDNKVDYILTHKYEQGDGTICPVLWELTKEWEATVQYSQWYYGHWHKDLQVDATHSIVFDKLTPVQ